MLSKRGQEYANSGLMSGYTREKKEGYNKSSNPLGEISFANAENVCPHHRIPYLKPKLHLVPDAG